MLINLDKCIGCQTCVVACRQHNAVPQGIWWLKFSDIAPNTKLNGTKNIPMQCQHCADPPCMKVCTTGATFVSAQDGTVQIDMDKCTGDTKCVTACPYNARQIYTEFIAKSHPRQIHDCPDGKLFRYGWQNDHKREGKIVFSPKHALNKCEKCTFCIQRIDNGQKPVCVDSCPVGARTFGDLSLTDSDITRQIKELKAVSYKAGETNCSPKIYYVLPKTNG